MPPPIHPKFPSFVWDWEGAKKCFILRDQTPGYLKSHHLQAWTTLTAMSVPPRPPFLSVELWVVRYHPGNLYRYYNAFTVYTRNIIKLKKSYNVQNKFLGHSQPLGGGEGEKIGLKYTACYVRNLKTALYIKLIILRHDMEFPKIWQV